MTAKTRKPLKHGILATWGGGNFLSHLRTRTHAYTLIFIVIILLLPMAAGCEQQPSLLPELEDSDATTRADTTATATPSSAITIEVDTAWAGEHHVYY